MEMFWRLEPGGAQALDGFYFAVPICKVQNLADDRRECDGNHDPGSNSFDDAHKSLQKKFLRHWERQCKHHRGPHAARQRTAVQRTSASGLVRR